MLKPYSLEAKSGDVTARPRQARDQAATNGIPDIREHDWYGPGRFQQRANGGGAGRQNDVRRQRDEFRRVSCDSVRYRPGAQR